MRHAFVAACFLCLAGCVSPVTVHQQGPAFAAREASFEVMPLDYSHARIPLGTPGIDWREEEKAEFEEAKVAANNAFLAEVVKNLHHDGIAATLPAHGDAHQTRYVITPEVLEVAPGDVTGATDGLATHMKVGVTIADREGHVIDVVEVEHGTTPGAFAGGMTERLVADGSTVGERLASYVHERVAPGSELR